MTYECYLEIYDGENDVVYGRCIELPFVPMVGMKLSDILFHGKSDRGLLISEVSWSFRASCFCVRFDNDHVPEGISDEWEHVG